PEELPPTRLLLATMPAEQLGKEPARVLFRASLSGLGRDLVSRGKSGGQRLLADLGVRPRLRDVPFARNRAWAPVAGQRGELLPTPFQPVAQPMVADDVVLVVAL